MSLGIGGRLRVFRCVHHVIDRFSIVFGKCGEYRIRTDDLLHAMQAL